MIGSLEGRLVERGPESALIDVRGVGYEVLMPLSTFLELPAEGKTIRLRIHTYVREDALVLYGFASSLERAVFRLLIGVSKIGPRIALAILSGVPAERFAQVIRGGDLAAFAGVPGVGRKTAERIVMELREKVDALGAARDSAAEGSAPPSDEAGESTLSALLNLGYSRAQAEHAVEAARRALGPGAQVESLVREALRNVAG